MNRVEAKATASGHILVTIKTGEIVQAQANLDLVQVRILLQELSLALDDAINHEWWVNNPEERAKNEKSIADYHAKISVLNEYLNAAVVCGTMERCSLIYLAEAFPA